MPAKNADMTLRSFSRLEAVQSGFADCHTPRDIIQLTRASSVDNNKEITTIGKLSNTNDYTLKTLSWIPLAIILYFVLMLSSHPESNPTSFSVAQLLTFIVFGISTQVAILVCYTVSKSTKLRSFETLYCRFEGFADLAVPYGIKEHPQKPLRTVSELMAVRGTFWHLVINQLGLAIFIFTSMVLILKSQDYIAAKKARNEGISNGIIALTCAFIGSFGGWTATMWELDPKDHISAIVHHIGVLFVFIGSFAAIIETNSNNLSISFVVIAVVAINYFSMKGEYMYDVMEIVLYRYNKHCKDYSASVDDNNNHSIVEFIFELMQKAQDKKMAERKHLTAEEVDDTSRKCIFAESVALLSAFHSICYFLYLLTLY